MQTRSLFAVVAGACALAITTGAWAQAFAPPQLSAESKACADCHKVESQAIYQQWGSSQH